MRTAATPSQPVDYIEGWPAQRTSPARSRHKAAWQGGNPSDLRGLLLITVVPVEKLDVRRLVEKATR